MVTVSGLQIADSYSNAISGGFFISGWPATRSNGTVAISLLLICWSLIVTEEIVYRNIVVVN